jgi:hypothetical protein
MSRQEKIEAWLLSEYDKRIFFKALINPPAPKAKLIEAMRKHKDFRPKE